MTYYVNRKISGNNLSPRIKQLSRQLSSSEHFKDIVKDASVPQQEHPSWKPFKCPSCGSIYFGPLWKGSEYVGRYCKGRPSGYDRSYIDCHGNYKEMFDSGESK